MTYLFSPRGLGESRKTLGLIVEVFVFFAAFTSGGLMEGSRKNAAAPRPRIKSTTTKVAMTTIARPRGWRAGAPVDENLRGTMRMIYETAASLTSRVAR